MLNRIARRALSVASALLLFSPVSAVYAQSVNLGSQTHSAVAPSAGFVMVGGALHHVNAGDSITPAELAALHQVTTTGQQTLLLGGAGNAIGGRLSLGGDIGANLSALSIPRNVTVLGNFAQISGLNVTGALSNSGALYAYATNPSITNATINAGSVLNNLGATISSLLPSSLGIRNANPELDLTFLTNSIVNHGTISSSRDISVIGSGAPLNITGSDGSWIARQLNLLNPTGQINADLGNVRGMLNSSALSEHIIATTPLLTLGNICVAGDPTYYNTAGSITIAGNITAAEELAILAAGDITTTAAVSITANDGSNGRAITLVAGANLSNGTGSNQVDPLPTTIDGPGAVDLTGGSATGGSITFTSGSSINSNAPNGKGGDILIAAFPGPGKGSISLPGTLLNSQSTGANNGGNITIIGAAGSTQAITIGTINAVGGLQVATAVP